MFYSDFENSDKSIRTSSKNSFSTFIPSNWGEFVIVFLINFFHDDRFFFFVGNIPNSEWFFRSCCYPLEIRIEGTIINLRIRLILFGRFFDWSNFPDLQNSIFWSSTDISTSSIDSQSINRIIMSLEWSKTFEEFIPDF